ncbi:MAG TPA: CBS domain-containing protein [Actinobacteria bacterium]|nr:CBS domain-containing protein [Actinomycetota bacterium]
MKIKDLMTKDPKTVQTTSTLVETARKMKELNVGFMPVMNGNALVGVVTDRDIAIRAVAEEMFPKETNAEDIMSANVHVASPDTSLEEAGEIMEKFRIRRLPVVDEFGVLVGICALGDIAVRGGNLEEAGEILEEISEPSRPEMAA